jgi:hypothetical protein
MDFMEVPMKRFNPLKMFLLLSTGLHCGIAQTHAETVSQGPCETEKFFVGKITKKTMIDQSGSDSSLVTLVNAIDLTVLISDKLEDMLQPIMKKKIPAKHHEKLYKHFKDKIEKQPQHIQTLQMSYVDSFNLSESLDSNTLNQVTQLFKKYGTKPMIEVAHELKNIIERSIRSSSSKKYTANENTKKIEHFTQCLLELVKEVKPMLRWIIDDSRVIKAAIPEIESMLNAMGIAIDDLLTLINLKPAQEFFKICCEQEDKIISTFQEWSISILNQIIQEKKDKS